MISYEQKKLTQNIALTESVVWRLASKIRTPEDLESVLDTLIMAYPTEYRQYLWCVQDAAVSAGMVEYKNYLLFEKLVDNRQISSDQEKIYFYYRCYQSAPSLLKKQYYKNRIKSEFKAYVRSEKQFEALNQELLSKLADSQTPRLTNLADLQDLPKVEFLVSDLLPQTGLALLTGQAKIGKSSLACDIAYSVVTGNPLFNIPINQGKVLVVSLDESKTETHVKYISRGFNKLENIHKKLKFAWEINSLKQLEKYLIKYQPNLIIIDSLHQLISNFNISENSSKLGRFLKELKTLLEKYNCVGLIIHHANKIKSGNIIAKTRGSSAISASTAVNLFLEAKNNQIILTATGRDIITREYKLNLNARENWETMGAYSFFEATGNRQEAIGEEGNSLDAEKIKTIIYSYGKISKDEIIQEAVKIAISEAQLETYLRLLEKRGEIISKFETGIENSPNQLFEIYCESKNLTLRR